MAAVATAPPPPQISGPSISRPTSATSRRSTPVPRKGSEGTPIPPAVIPEETTLEASLPEDGAPTPRATTPRPASPSVPHRPAIRPIPAARSKFDLEPNPFEQSFRVSHHSDSQEDVNESSGNTPPRGGDATAIKHNALPPLSSLTSPAAADPSQFPWLATQGLRTGPLSPAMLTGPQNRAGGKASNGADGEHEAFDSSNFRTGFTPGTGSGFTPNFSSMMGGSGFSNLPMPSPNTAAFLNMVTNATPIEGDTNENSTSQHTTSQPPSAIPPHLQQAHHGLSHISNHTDIGQDTITPNTLSALTGVVNDMNRQGSGMGGPQGPPNFYPPHTMPPQHHQPVPHPNGNGNVTGNGVPYPPGPGAPHVDYAQQSANAASQAANGLFLLSQAHQELSKREEEGRRPVPPGHPQHQQQGAPPMGIPGMGGMAPGAAHQHAMMYPGHPGHPGQGMGGQPIPSSALHQYQQPPPHAPPPISSQMMAKRSSNSGPVPNAATLASAAAHITNNGIPPPVPAVPVNTGTKRKSDAADTAPAPKAKKGKKGAAAAAAAAASAGGSPGKEKAGGRAGAVKGESTSPMSGNGMMGMSSFRGMGGMMGMGPDDDDDDMESEHDGISKITGKPETEEEKRKNFLERNRQAALKCRQRKKQWLNELQSKVESLQMENDRLNQTVAGLHDEIGRLSGVLIQHRDCGLGLPTGYGRAPMR